MQYLIERIFKFRPDDTALMDFMLEYYGHLRVSQVNDAIFTGNDRLTPFSNLPRYIHDHQLSGEISVRVYGGHTEYTAYVFPEINVSVTPTTGYDPMVSSVAMYCRELLFNYSDACFEPSMRHDPRAALRESAPPKEVDVPTLHDAQVVIKRLSDETFTDSKCPLRGVHFYAHQLYIMQYKHIVLALKYGEGSYIAQLAITHDMVDGTTPLDYQEPIYWDGTTILAVKGRNVMSPPIAKLLQDQYLGAKTTRLSTSPIDRMISYPAPSVIDFSVFQQAPARRNDYTARQLRI